MDAAEERARIGPIQRDDRLFEHHVGRFDTAGDGGQRVAGLHRHRARGRRRRGGRTFDRRTRRFGAHGTLRRNARAGRRRRRGGCRCGRRCRRSRCRRRGRGRGRRGLRAARLGHRYHHGRRGVLARGFTRNLQFRRIEQERVLADELAGGPVQFHQQIDEWFVQRLRRGDAHQRPPVGPAIDREAKLRQRQPVFQTGLLERIGRGQLDRQRLCFLATQRGDLDFRAQRLTERRLHREASKPRRIRLARCHGGNGNGDGHRKPAGRRKDLRTTHCFPQ